MTLENDALDEIEAFAGLGATERRELEKHLELVSTPRGEMLVRQGDAAHALYIVVTGRFEVLREGSLEPIAWIGPGQPIGEIAFFSKLERTASVRALRDSLCLRLTIKDFNHLAHANPGVWPAVTATMAQRLARTTAATGDGTPTKPRTICICRAGHGACPEPFLSYVRETFSNRAGCLVLDRASATSQLPSSSNESGAFDSTASTRWFNELEGRFKTVIYIADHDANAWSIKALHQADQVLCVAWHSAHECGGDEIQRNDLERQAGVLHNRENIRLVLMHERPGTIQGTRHWLERRPGIGMHHHIAITRTQDFDRLFRFVFGEAVGLVACGGGAFTAAHVGSYEAFVEHGVTFDIFGGTSGGAAMTAGFALGVPADEMSTRIHKMFVERHAMGRWTFPRYSFLDHTVLNEVLEQYFSNTDIEDMWLPYFAAATNLSTNQLWPIRQGPLWEAIRASSAIPALFPPVFSKAGDMLVDGCLIDNMPVATMRAMKSGPNVIFNLEVPRPRPKPIDHRTLPSRWRVLWQMIFARPADALHEAQGPHTVLMNSLMRQGRDTGEAVGSKDFHLNSPIPEDASALDWSNHETLRQSAYAHATHELAIARRDSHPLLVNQTAAT